MQHLVERHHLVVAELLPLAEPVRTPDLSAMRLNLLQIDTEPWCSLLT
jgi:hypothetical protein